ncbi:2'-5' RNA ligase family protein [Planococcus liqunii]|uniref:2'-5' RNA ligase family protein n=1 Tax=Planococcus liqunii TaxID=3058394 RepID=A0ABT8MMQ2_9BACL|nr:MULTISPECIES: 2'-5' RNA ligase family protein [unclassified Planococcus (in: firmicutes)]MDN7226148.1 2'-5' RNA ligase family protein [Planococcus sp. N064]WKA49932.1 2'-5' RNA ligase family protein [Planococcus sp. N056]
MQVIVMRFDYPSSAIFEQLQQQAQYAASKQKATLPPHITLQSFTQPSPLDLKKAIEPWAEKTKQLSLSFASLGFFKQQGSFYAAPIVTKALAALHSAINLSTREFTGHDAFYMPDHWVPHATIINHIAPPFWGPLFARLSMEFEPFTAKAVAIECWSIVQGKAQTEWSIFLSE